MQLGMIGLGRMGANMVRRLMRGGHHCVVFDKNPENVEKLKSEGAAGASSLEEFTRALAPPRVAWMMVPAAVVDGTLAELTGHLVRGDTAVDGGNSYYIDDIRRAGELEARGIHYLDVGVSGGVWGLERGYCQMIGGRREAVEPLHPLFRTLAPGPCQVTRTMGRENIPGTAEEGFLHCGPSGAGHFVKMVHNGIEYGIMQAYAEGFDIFKNATSKELPEDIRYDLNLPDIAEVWRRGSVISSWLLDLTAMALAAKAISVSDMAGSIFASPRPIERVATLRFIVFAKGLSRQASRMTSLSRLTGSSALSTRSSDMVSSSTSKSLSSLASAGTR